MKTPANRATLRDGQGITWGAASPEDQLPSVSISQTTEPVSALFARVLAPPGTTSEAKPPSSFRHLVRRVLPEEPGSQPPDASRCPPSCDCCAGSRGSYEHELLVIGGALSQLSPISPPRFFREVGSADAHDIEVPGP